MTSRYATFHQTASRARFFCAAALAMRPKQVEFCAPAAAWEQLRQPCLPASLPHHLRLCTSNFSRFTLGNG